MEANDEKRKSYQEFIEDVPPQDIVSIDQSGIEITICKDKGWGKKRKKLLGQKER